MCKEADEILNTAERVGILSIVAVFIRCSDIILSDLNTCILKALQVSFSLGDNASCRGNMRGTVGNKELVDEEADEQDVEDRTSH
jgi:hypothetical protein